MEKTNLIKHYDMLIDEDNDPVQDSNNLQSYMNKWDGEYFIEQLKLTEKEDVLEIGVGTGRIAKKIIANCKSFTGIDISPKTIARAREHLKEAILICDDFLHYDFGCKYDVIYSSLTFLHIKNKREVISKIRRLLKDNGRVVISFSMDKSTSLTYGERALTLFPNDLKKIENIIKHEELLIINKKELENATVFVFSNNNL